MVDPTVVLSAGSFVWPDVGDAEVAVISAKHALPTTKSVGSLVTESVIVDVADVKLSTDVALTVLVWAMPENAATVHTIAIVDSELLAVATALALSPDTVPIGRKNWYDLPEPKPLRAASSSMA